MSVAPMPAANALTGRRASARRVLVATVVKELRIAKRYVPDLLGRLVEFSVRVGFFFLLSNIVSINRGSSPLGAAMTGRDLATFFLGALLLFVFNRTALYAPVDSVSTDLYNGTLEYLFTTPASRYAYFAGTVAAHGLVNLTMFAPLFVVFVAVAHPPVLDTIMVLLVCFAVLGTVVAFGVGLALLAILWRQVGSILNVLGIMFELLAGAYFPVAAFPRLLRYLAYALPYTWGYDLIRFYSFRHRWATLLPVRAEWLLLAGFAAVFVTTTAFLLRRAEARAKRRGLHLI